MTSTKKTLTNSVVCMGSTSTQPSISSLFANAKSKPKILTTVIPTIAVPATEVKKLTSTDPIVQAFYDSLSPGEIIAHTIAIEKLGTSYDVTRIRGFLAWKKTR